jgi:hypothetical protein
MQRSNRPSIQQARVLALVLGLLLAQLLWQTLGQMHRVLHYGHAAALQNAAAVGPKHGHPGNDGLAALFAGHGDEGSCRLFDQLGQCDALAMPSPAVLPLVLLAFLPSFSLGEVLARRAALFQARGPPSFR